MGPEQPSPNVSPRVEQAPSSIGYELTPANGVESAPERSVERAPAIPGEVLRPQPAQPSVASLPQPVADDPASDVQGSSQTSPILASDDDLIEKEWVEQVKQVLTTTKDDPYLREQEISKLQRDYIWKRYGRKIGSHED